MKYEKKFKNSKLHFKLYMETQMSIQQKLNVYCIFSHPLSSKARKLHTSQHFKT